MPRFLSLGTAGVSRAAIKFAIQKGVEEAARLDKGWVPADGFFESRRQTLEDEAQTRIWVEEAIASTGASEKKDMGKVMGALMGAHKAELDGNVARQIVQELLS